MNFLLNLIKKYRELFLYGIIGGISSGLDFIIYTILVHSGFYYLLANIIGVHCGIFCSFIFNRQYYFKVKDKTKLRFISFYIIGLTGLGLSTLMLYGMVTLANWNEIYSKLTTIVVVALIQFIMNKFITFKK